MGGDDVSLRYELLFPVLHSLNWHEKTNHRTVVFKYKRH